MDNPNFALSEKFCKNHKEKISEYICNSCSCTICLECWRDHIEKNHNTVNITDESLKLLDKFELFFSGQMNLQKKYFMLNQHNKKTY